MDNKFTELRKHNSELAYEYLKRKNYALYRRVIETIGAVCLQTRLNLPDSARIEASVVALVVDLIQKMEKDNVDKPDNS